MAAPTSTRRDAHTSDASSESGSAGIVRDSAGRLNRSAYSGVNRPKCDGARIIHGEALLPLTAGTRLGPYDIVSPLGAGGMGEVYRALDPRLGRAVAIKLLPTTFADDPDRLRRFEREARAIGALNHPHICTVHDVGEHNGQRYLVMELLEGHTLAARLAHGPVPFDVVVAWAIQITEALEAAHAAGFVHRDLKPANIFITRRNEAKVLDFGLAKMTATAPATGFAAETIDPDNAGQTSAGTMLGTVAYVSPEQARGEQIGPSSDLFSFGVVLYEMTTGHSPFQGPTTAVTFDAILNKEPIPPERLNAALPIEMARIIRKALEKDSELRYQSAADVRADLKRLKRDIESAHSPLASRNGGPLARTGAMPSGPRSWFERRSVGLVLAMIGALLAAAGGFVAARRVASPSAPPPSTVSLDMLQIEQLTTSGTAIRAALSPEGKYVAYIQRDENEDTLWVRQVATASNVPIVAAEPDVTLSAVTVTPDGNYVDFVRGRLNLRDLWRVPFLGGPPTRILERVDSPTGWSADGQRVAFVRMRPDRGASSVLVADAALGQEHLLVERRLPSRFVSLNLVRQPSVAPAWSPDGSTLAVAGLRSTAEGSTAELVFIGTDTGKERVVTLGPSVGASTVVNGLVWITDQDLVLTRAAETGSPIQLWTLSYPEGSLTRLTNDLSNYAGVSLTAARDALVTSRIDRRVGVWVGTGDGRSGKEIVAPAPSSEFSYNIAWAGDRVLYTSSDGRGRSVTRIARNGADAEKIIDGGVFPSATSDGAVVIFTSSARKKSGVWRLDTRTGRTRQLVPGDAIWTAVTPDDQSAIYVTSRNGIQAPWIVPLEGGEARPLSTETASAMDVSPDGKKLSFSSAENTFVICELPECASPRVVRGFPGFRGGDRHWTPDSTAIAYWGAGSELWLQPIDGSPARQLTDLRDRRAIADFAWSRDGKYLAIARGVVTSDIVLFKGLQGAKP